MRNQADTMREVVIGTAGHIDHGKTALVHALTGIDTDRLPDEKRRGITIDLGFASLAVQSPGGTPLTLSFVDVPGHHLFVRNMLAGAAGVDLVMLVISAEEGVKPQTEEHLAICGLLGISRGLTVLTKIDAVSEDRLRRVCLETEKYLKGSFLEGSPIIPVSAFTGAGLPELRAKLSTLAAEAPAHKPDVLPRLPLDRAFVMRGFGTVVTGTLQTGTIRQGDTLTIEPGHRAVRVRGLQKHGTSYPAVSGGSRVALNLAGVEVSDVRRGDMLLAPSTFTPVDTVDVEISLLPGAAPLKHRSRVRVHAFTSDTLATISLFEYAAVPAGSAGLARLRLAKPIVFLPGDRFVLRQCSPATTIGGGRVLDAHPLPKLKRAACATWLETIRHERPEGQILPRVGRRGMEGIRSTALIAETGLSPSEIENETSALIRSKELVSAGDGVLVTRNAYEQAIGMLAAAIDEAGGSGRKRSELRQQTGLPEPVFDAALDTLTHQRTVTLQGDLVRSSRATAQLSTKDQQQLAAVERAFSTAGLLAPLLRDVMAQTGLKEPELRRCMTLLLREGSLVKVGADDLYMHKDALQGLYAQIRAKRGESLDVSKFKEITGLSRKYAVPLLEHLDRLHLTRRQGDTRLVL